MSFFKNKKGETYQELIIETVKVQLNYS